MYSFVVSEAERKSQENYSDVWSSYKSLTETILNLLQKNCSRHIPRKQRQPSAVNKYKTILKLHNTDCLHELLSQTLFVSLISEFGWFQGNRFYKPEGVEPCVRCMWHVSLCSTVNTNGEVRMAVCSLDQVSITSVGVKPSQPSDKMRTWQKLIEAICCWVNFSLWITTYNLMIFQQLIWLSFIKKCFINFKELTLSLPLPQE